jgi:hypothetical protein
MVSRSSPVAVIWWEAPLALSFLAEDWGFTGPQNTVEGVAYHRPGLHVDMGFWAWKNECGFTTTLALVSRDGKQLRASLGALYAASGLGSASAAPEGAGTLYVIRKRIGQHAAALRALMACLDGGDLSALFEACSRNRAGAPRTGVPLPQPRYPSAGRHATGSIHGDDEPPERAAS